MHLSETMVKALLILLIMKKVPPKRGFRRYFLRYSWKSSLHGADVPEVPVRIKSGEIRLESDRIDCFEAASHMWPLGHGREGSRLQRRPWNILEGQSSGSFQLKNRRYGSQVFFRKASISRSRQS